MNRSNAKLIKVGIAGTGAIGRVVARALIDGIEGYELTALSDLYPTQEFTQPYVPLEKLPEHCDLVIECLPPSVVPLLAKTTFVAQKNLILISSCALLIYPELGDIQKQSTSRIFVPSGALAGLDGVKAMREMGITKCTIASTKHPRGFSTAPFILESGINVDKIETKMKLFMGTATEAAKGFPSNVNVAATLALASGKSPESTLVEIWADPEATGNTHEISVETAYSRLNVKIENLPDPQNPKSSVLAARSIIALLRNMNGAIALL